MADFADVRRTDGNGITLATAATAKVGSTCTANLNGTVLTVLVARDLAVAVGDILVLALVQSQLIAIARYGAAPPLDTGSAAGVPVGATTGGLTLSPIETRSWRPGGWRTDNLNVYQGQYGGQGNHTGAAFYGGGFQSLAGATATSAAMVVKRLGSGGPAGAVGTTMRLITESFRPGGAPTLGASTAGPSLPWNGYNAVFGVPQSWAQALIDGSAGGIGFFTSSGDPYVIFAGKGEYGPAFTMSITWSR